jgi:type I restriction enzyme S subunit
MFGDPATNPKGWCEDTRLGDVAEIVSGVTKGRRLNGEKAREVPYLAVVNVQDRALNLSTLKSIEATEAEIDRYRLMRGDLLLTEGGDPDKLGRGTLWNDELPECIHQNHIFRVRLTTNRLHPLFLNWLVSSQRGKNCFLRSAKQTTGIASINMTQLRGFPLLIPPTEIQQAFAARATDVSRLRASAAESGASMDDLFVTLQHRAFRGEL